MGKLQQCLSGGSRLASSLKGGSLDLPVQQGVSQCVHNMITVRLASGGGSSPTSRDAKAKAPSKVVKKGSKAAAGDGEDGSDKRDRFASLVDACLDAPTPVRALKEKERVREMEREKLGIVSKDKERHLEREKAKAKAAAKDNNNKNKAGGKDEELSKLNPEEGMRLAKEHSRYLMKEARLRAAAEGVRLQLKQDAIAALPPHLREVAMVPDLTPFPRTRIPAAISPPIAGYMEEMAKAAEQASKIQKSR
ncbi:hypothetical protein CY35_10G052700 [Sphagnum magellanicum]|nr:hypothetical protein CY35_10G052700 [Sphagnum magellanicum]